ncbi:HAMP domain-containing histidine kinase [Candidatus Sumerlaeota bacterium]|nr:HAMP domain-containing histidine kinase [Candidatus Sumerlaeota bacterium]
MEKRTVPRWPIVLATGVIIAALGTLAWLREQLIDSEKSVIRSAVQRFEVTNVLGRPESSSLIFGEIETQARVSEGSAIRDLCVTKRMIDGTEITVYPYYADLLDPNWRTARPWTRLAVGAEPQVQGYLYIQTNNSTLKAVNAVIALLSVVLAGGFAVLVIRQRGKEEELGRSLLELESSKAQMIHLERLALAGQLSANVFHDIKKPVLNIKNEVMDSLEGAPTPPEEVYRAIRAQTELFLQMLRDLGMETFVNASAQSAEWCDIVDAVDRSLRLVKYEQGSVAVDVTFEKGHEFFIQTQPHKLVQIFSNLILNAYQAMGNSGRLRVLGRIAEAERRMVVTVEDSGPGIPAAKREEVFKPFLTSRASSGGSGLGLYICRTIIADLGGSIVVDEAPELGGTRFTIKLPMAHERASREVRRDAS